ncbi:MAG TPA: acyl-CoA dehydrogenase family protein [Polyangiaceae bacterium LLY-WYZ-14_1]|jgi:alkylation response protein AidB-like acyl-CoA dehydrogenase|nr:acyl-CoA dehydrogenase family protein [Polyangiaceae bacterium LLY-WYZ-14_1]
MDLRFTPEQDAFRQEVREWIPSAMPDGMREKAANGSSFSMPEIMEWHRVLYDKGWVAPHWPKEYGGAGLDAARRFILSEELELANAPQLSPFGLSMVGPLLMQFGNDAQKQRFLPKILTGEEVWCQGYSEPNAGSDLAALRTSAEDDGNGNFILNGQKTWTTYAQYADWIFCLVRTDSSGKKQEGISFILIDLKTPGVTVKPMLTLGDTPAFCDTYFENAKVPKENVVGTLNGGWTLAKALLGHERTLIAAVGTNQRMLRQAKRIAADHGLLDDPRVAERIADLEVRLEALRWANYRALAGAQLGKAPGPESSILKIVGTELVQQIGELTLDIMGDHALAWFNEPGIIPALEQDVASMYCYNRATTIYGGSNEIQKNIIAKHLLGLPS